MSILRSSTIFLLCALFLHCGKDNCDTDNSEFQTLCQTLIDSGYTDEVTFDSPLHTYTFTLSEDRKLCKIGYQSDSDIASTPYAIEIIDNATATTIYANSHVFSDSEISYVKPSNDVLFKADVSYTINRIQSDYGSNITNTIGRIIWQKPLTMEFPYSQGVLTITGGGFSENAPRRAIPYIDLVLK